MGGLAREYTIMFDIHIPENFIVLVLMIVAVGWFFWMMMKGDPNGRD